MKPLVSFGEALELDRCIQDRYRLSEDTLMEAASSAMTRIILSNAELVEAMRGSRIPALALCGSGNNGGDALAVLRHLAFEGWTGLVAVVAGKPGNAAGRRLAEAESTGLAVLSPEDPAALNAVSEAGIVIDGISGIGYHGARRAAFRSLAGLLGERRRTVVAIDVPSGIGAPETFEAEPEAPVPATVTLCVEPLKAGLFNIGWRRFSGDIVPVSGVFPRSSGSGSGTMLLEEADLASRLPAPDPDGHKGTRGALVVYAGNIGSTGAAALCARSGSAGGAGSVTLIVRDAIVEICSGLLCSQMVRPVSDPGTRRFTAIVAGPGWGLDAGNGHALDRLWELELPLVLDADAIRMVAANPKPRRRHPLLLTPHPGEFAPLAACAAGYPANDPAALAVAMRRTMFDTPAVLAQTAAYFGAVIILKGSVTWIGDPGGRMSVWDGRVAALGTAGSGDVLAGLLGAFLARGMEAWAAAEAAVMVHGLAGRKAADGGFFEASDLLRHTARLAYGRIERGNQG